MYGTLGKSLILKKKKQNKTTYLSKDKSIWKILLQNRAELKGELGRT